MECALDDAKFSSDADAERAPVKKQEHRALADIRESIEELKYYRKNVFKRTKSDASGT